MDVLFVGVDGGLIDARILLAAHIQILILNTVILIESILCLRVDPQE